MVIKRFGIYLVSLDPTVGSEISKTRPCVIVSPNEMNRHIRTVIIAPLTSTRKNYPTRVPCKVAGRTGEIMLDQLRTIDKTRLIKFLGDLGATGAAAVLNELQEMFSP